MSCYPRGFKSRRRNSSDGNPNIDDDPKTVMGWLERWSSNAATFVDGFEFGCSVPNNRSSSPSGGGTSLHSPALSSWCPHPQHNTSDYYGGDIFKFANINRDYSVLDDESIDSDKGGKNEDDEDGVYEYFDRSMDDSSIRTSLRPIKVRPNKPKSGPSTSKDTLHQQQTIQFPGIQENYYSEDDDGRIQTFRPHPTPSKIVSASLADDDVPTQSFETAVTASMSLSWSNSSSTNNVSPSASNNSASDTLSCGGTCSSGIQDHPESRESVLKVDVSPTGKETIPDGKDGVASIETATTASISWSTWSNDGGASQALSMAVSPSVSQHGSYFDHFVESDNNQYGETDNGELHIEVHDERNSSATTVLVSHLQKTRQQQDVPPKYNASSTTPTTTATCSTFQQESITSSAFEEKQLCQKPPLRYSIHYSNDITTPTVRYCDV